MNDFERLVKKEVPGIYQYYREQITPPEPDSNRLRQSLLFVRDMFIVFLNKLTPVRRVVYSIGLFFFMWGYLHNSYFYIFLAFAIVNFLLAFELADKLSVKDELDVAKKIQQDLMPPQAPEFPCFEISCYISTARDVGGDYYDFIKLNENGKFLFVIGDISGKGMAAALNMIQVRTLLHILSSKNDEIHSLTTDLNAQLFKFFKKEYFFTANIVSISQEGNLSFCRAGHMPVLHYKFSDKSISIHKPKGIGLGLTGGSIFEESLEIVELQPATGDVLLFYTDGVNESMNEYGELFGEERLKKIMEKNAHRPTEQIKRDLTYHISNFTGDIDQHDDITFVLFKVK